MISQQNNYLPQWNEGPGRDFVWKVRHLFLEIGQEHEAIDKLKKMIEGELPDSADDFKKTKWFQK